MASVKLTTPLRNSIVDALIVHAGFYADEIQAKADYEQVQYSFYNEVFEHTLPIVNKVNKMFLTYGGQFTIDFHTVLTTDPTLRDLLGGRTCLQVRVPNGHPRPTYPLTLDDLGVTLDNPTVQALLQKYKDWVDEAAKVKQAWDKVYLAISRFETVEQLLATWVDIVPIVASILPQTSSDTTVRKLVPELNELLGLKKEDK